MVLAAGRAGAWRAYRARTAGVERRARSARATLSQRRAQGTLSAGVSAFVLSACLIVRDEAARLAHALASLRGVADELCVVDTGSRDDTVAIARAAGARVECAEWTDDFAAARNRSLALATGTWVLVLDADEVLDTESGRTSDAARARFMAFAAARPGCAGQLEIVNTNGGETSTFLAPRFLPRTAGLRYRGRVHEQPELDGRTPSRAPVGVRVFHTGYEAARVASADKLARNRRLLALALADDPADAYLWYQLGRTEHVAGASAAALAACERALALATPDAPWHASLVETAAYALRELGRSAEARARLAPDFARHAERADTCFVAALLALDAGDVADAERGFRRALELGARGAGESSSAASGWGALFNLGVLREVVGEAGAAEELYLRALALRPGHAPIVAGLTRVRAARGT